MPIPQLLLRNIAAQDSDQYKTRSGSGYIELLETIGVATYVATPKRQLVTTVKEQS